MSLLLDSSKTKIGIFDDSELRFPELLLWLLQLNLKEKNSIL